MRVSPSTLYVWKTDATKPPSLEAKPETKPNATGKTNTPKQAPRHSQPNTGETPPPSDLTAALLAAKDAQIALLTTELSRWQAQTERLTDALTEERRRTDVLQLQALERRALPSDDARPTHGTTANRRELWVFAAAVAALALLALALLLSR